MGDASYEWQRRNEKINLLLPVFEAHIEAHEHRPLDRLGDDAELIYETAKDLLNGPTVTIHTEYGPKETYVFWNTIASLAGIPEKRYPSTRTIRALVSRLRRRAEDTMTVAELFAQAGAA